MQNFAKSRGIKFSHSSPGYAKFNGLTERIIKIVMYELNNRQTRPSSCIVYPKKHTSDRYRVLGRYGAVLQPAGPKDVQLT